VLQRVTVSSQEFEVHDNVAANRGSVYMFISLNLLLTSPHNRVRRPRRGLAELSPAGWFTAVARKRFWSQNQSKQGNERSWPRVAHLKTLQGPEGFPHQHTHTSVVVSLSSRWMPIDVLCQNPLRTPGLLRCRILVLPAAPLHMAPYMASMPSNIIRQPIIILSQRRVAWCVVLHH
jgi:hypothetical protein